MSTNTGDVKKMLQDILGKFLNGEESSEVFNQLFQPSAAPSAESINDTAREHLSFELDHRFFYGTKIDLLIASMERKLAPADNYRFLLDLGQLAIFFGELRLAGDIYRKLIKQVKNIPEYMEIAGNANLGMAFICRRQARWDDSLEYAAKAITLFNNCGSKVGYAKCENLLGNIKSDCGDVESAKYHYQKSLSLLAAEDEMLLSAALETNIGILCNMQGLFDDALKYFSSALERFKILNDKARIAILHHNIGMVYLQKNDYDTAVNEFDKSISVSVEANNLSNMGMSYLSKAYLYAKIKDHLLASAYADKALEICYKLNDQLSIAEIYKVKGIINKNLNNFTLSESYFLTSLRINRELNNALNEAETSFETALLYRQANRIDEAVQFFTAAKQYYLKIRSDRDIAAIDAMLNEPIA